MIDDPNETNEFIQRPRWRVRTTPVKRRRLALVAFAFVVVLGLALMAAMIWLLDRAGATPVVVLLSWLVPTVGILVWVLGGATPAVADDDAQSWPGYSIRYVLVGEDQPRTIPARVAASVVFGGPVGWALALFGIASVLGLF